MISNIIPGFSQAQQKRKVQRVTRGQLLACSIVLLRVHSSRAIGKWMGQTVEGLSANKRTLFLTQVSSLLTCAAPNHDQMRFLKPIITIVNT
jgi:hypothetical protein